MGFCSLRPVGYYKPNRVSGRIKEFMQRTGLPGSMHSLRHFAASYTNSPKIGVMNLHRSVVVGATGIEPVTLSLEG
jgi:hypothetical protein